MSLLYGKELARRLQERLSEVIREKQLHPCLAVLLIGQDPASELYVSLKKKAAQEVGIEVRVTHITEPTTDEAVEKIVHAWNTDPSVHGILIQLPLPPPINTQALIDTIDPRKDVDGFHPETIAALKEGAFTFISPVHESVLQLIAASPLTINTATVAILANSTVFSEPLASLLRKAGAFVHVFSPQETDKKILATADIVIIAMGRAHFLNPTLTKRGAVLIDVGTTRGTDGRVLGDVDQAAYQDQPETTISAVPGGIGPLTIAHLLKNTVIACQRAKKTNP
jgi:methylenetetrahydrofolate dehydrogenase (NADP+)/methenyltetrahydrofolate cyclohydrolase